MDTFLQRKRKHAATMDSTTTTFPQPQSNNGGDEESTDVKLAILASLYPDQEQDHILEVLLSCDGSVDKAIGALSTTNGFSPRKKRPSTVGLQSALSFNTRDTSKRLGRSLTKKGRTLHLFTPEDVVAHTPCSVIHNFLPTHLANDLLRELLPEVTSYSSATFKLFDNVVQSPHTACFYVDSLAERERQKSEYLYNGSNLDDVREILPTMRRVSSLVRTAVNAEVATRIQTHYPGGTKLLHQSPHEWIPNAAFVNCYDGGAQSVGYHSDQLSYLGPRAIIGSLSLGVAREFRVRRIVPKDEDNQNSAADESGQISIHLPHNSLVVMHAEMQEEWKHAITPAKSIDPHPIAGNKRINITYRWYRESFNPKYTPKCRCGVPTVLKTVQKQRTNRGRYMWMCQVGGQIEGGKSCGYFEWAEFTEDGEPIWKHEIKGVKKDEV